MSHGKRLLLYILLNIVVSAGTTLAVLCIWNQIHPSFSLTAYFDGKSAETNAATATPTVHCSQVSTTQLTPLPVNQELIAIDNIYGTGKLENELVVIKNKSSDKISLTGWCLENKNGTHYSFPDLTLNPNSQVQVHTAAGTNTVADLFWDRDQATWQEGDTAILVDAQGIQRATFTIP